MIIPLGRSYSIRLADERLKGVCCQKCALSFLYRMRREARGSGFSLLWLDNDGAKRRAATEAAKKLTKSLNSGYDVVACPQCGNYQPRMVRRIRLRRVGWSVLTALILWIVIWIALRLINLPPATFATVSKVTNGVMQAAAAAALILPWVFNPNASAQARIPSAQANPKVLFGTSMTEVIVAAAKLLEERATKPQPSTRAPNTPDAAAPPPTHLQ